MFVVFEGIDGSGKTTVSNLVVQRLERSGLRVKHLRAEGKFASSVTEAIRSLARDSRHMALDPRAEFLLYVARDVQLVEEALREALSTHDVVFADRFFYTAEVLARHGRGLPASYVEPVIAAATGELKPDLVVLVDVDPVLARARRKASKLLTREAKPPSRKGLAGVGLQHRVRRGYLELAAASPERWFAIENEGALEQTVSTVTRLVESALQQGVQRALERERAGSVASCATHRSLRTPEDALAALCRWVHERAEREPQVAAYLLAGLSGEPIDELRSELAERVPTLVLAGLAGLDDAHSWRLRERWCDRHPDAVARSLDFVTVHSQACGPLLPRLERLAPMELVRALARSDHELAWQVRERLYGAHEAAVIASLAALSSARAEAMRRTWLDRNWARIGDDYELARSAARAVHELDDDLAWEVRKAIRNVAPVASLASLGASTSDKSFVMREQSLHRATKVVMETLRHVRDERAFPLRWAVAAEVKEAVDSIVGLDDHEAWKMRETFVDVWPSTVVKTLGPLADGERGRALVTRQLAHHAHNISLLKHTAAIALGVHRLPGRLALDGGASE
jgi:dTMP kinase